MNKNVTIFVAGHNGLVGSAILRLLLKQDYLCLTAEREELNLENHSETRAFFDDHNIDYVFLCAAKVAGIEGNMKEPVDMLLRNLKIQTNVIEAAHAAAVRKLLFFGSSCIYPRLCPQPIKEEYLLSGSLEPSNEPYAISKIVGLKLCQAYHKQHGDNFVSVMPTNLLGTGDNYQPGGHVIPELIRKFHVAKSSQEEVIVWGDGTARREFLFSDDLASACLTVMNHYDSPEPINIGYGSDISIKELAEIVADTVGLERGRLIFKPTGPVGTPVKLLDSSKIMALGWKPTVNLADGLKIAYEDFLKNHVGKL
jgi:GDP-L-fucose synthase